MALNHRIKNSKVKVLLCKIEAGECFVLEGYHSLYIKTGIEVTDNNGIDMLVLTFDGETEWLDKSVLVYPVNVVFNIREDMLVCEIVE